MNTSDDEPSKELKRIKRIEEKQKRKQKRFWEKRGLPFGELVKKYKEELKEKLQKFFDKEIYSISENEGLYYVVLEGQDFIKPVYEVNLDAGTCKETGIPLPELETYSIVYSKFEG